MLTDTTRVGGRTMRPPAPSYAPGPIPLHRLLRAVLFNPLQIWSREHFEEPLVVSRTPLGTRLVVSDPEAIKWILVDNSSNYVRDSLQQRILLRTTGRSLFSAEGADWRLLRKTFAPFFSRRALGAFLPGMMAAADKLVARLAAAGGEDIELDREMAAATVDVLSRTLFTDGFGESESSIATSVRRFADASGAVGVGDLLNLPAWFPRIRGIAGWQTTRAVRKRARRIVAAAKMSTVSGDIVSAIVQARDADTGRTFGSREVEDNVSTLIGAGSDTVAVALTWSIFLLSEMPEIRESIEAEVDACLNAGPITSEALDQLIWTRATIEEAMRLYPPAPLIGRMALAADTICGQRFPAGTTILIAPWVVHRHMRLWSDPELFAPERFLPGRREGIPRFAYLPFGAGPRGCIGMGFAMQEAVVLLSRLAQQLRFERADDRPVRLRQCLTLQPEGGLRMRVQRRKASVTPP
jgi:cytochrome P450